MTDTFNHGGDWFGFEIKHGKAPLDFSANINPLGMPEGIKKAIAFSILMSDRYPDPFCRELREKISHKESIPSA